MVTEDETYTVHIYTDGSKTDAGVGAGIAIYTPNEPVYKTCYRLNNRCSNNQAEQIAILKALEELHHLDNITNKSAALHGLLICSCFLLHIK